MHQIYTCYSSRYYAPTPTASMRKLPLIAQEAEKRNLVKIVEPEDLDIDKLFSLHKPEYVRSFLEGRGHLASSQGWSWTDKIKNGVVAINGGQLTATRLALEHGIAANIAQGFHHAVYAQGMGYCTFNGLALIAQEFPSLRVGVLDCDEHQGNGTADFSDRLNNLYNFTIFGSSFNVSERPRSLNRQLPSCTHEFELYLAALDEAFNQLWAWKINFLIYQAGADPHINDPLGSLGLTTDQLRARDRKVFEFSRQSKIPILFVMAGGYQEPMDTGLVPLHVATFEEACAVYGASHEGNPTI